MTEKFKNIKNVTYPQRLTRHDLKVALDDIYASTVKLLNAYHKLSIDDSGLGVPHSPDLWNEVREDMDSDFSALLGTAEWIRDNSLIDLFPLRETDADRQKYGVD